MNEREREKKGGSEWTPRSRRDDLPGSVYGLQNDLLDPQIDQGPSEIDRRGLPIDCHVPPLGSNTECDHPPILSWINIYLFYSNIIVKKPSYSDRT